MDNETTPQVPGQRTLPGMAESLGYDTIALKPSEERFCWRYVANGGIGVKACQELYPKISYSAAGSRASELLKKPEITARINQVREEIAREEKQTLKDFIVGTLTFDPAEAFKGGNRVDIANMPEKIRKLCSLESRIVDGSLVYLPVFPDKVKAGSELAKMMGAYAAEKKELTGADGGALTIIGEIILVPAGSSHE